MQGCATLDDADLSGKRVLVRVDINVPFKDGKVTDDMRITTIAPTLKEILAKGGKPVVLAHRGRPKGKYDPELTIDALRQPLSAAIGAPVELANIDTAAGVAENLAPGTILLLENIRFYPEETRNDSEFSRRLAGLGDIYVNDAFSVAHRAHSSTHGVAQYLPSLAGRLMEAELQALEKALSAPERPVVAVVGGAKISTKIDLLANLIDKVDQIIIGGGMANTFLAANGKLVGKSLCEHELLDTAKEIMAKASGSSCEIVLPVDVVVAREFAANAPSEVVSVDACPEDAMILDAGPRSVEDIIRRFEAAKTIVWNGPLGAFEIEPFNTATDAAARKAGELAASGRVLAVAGGGDTVAALNGCGAAEKFTYVSTAGGAFLEWLEGKTLPGVAALEENRPKTAAA